VTKEIRRKGRLAAWNESTSLSLSPDKLVQKYLHTFFRTISPWTIRGIRNPLLGHGGNTPPPKNKKSFRGSVIKSPSKRLWRAKERRTWQTVNLYAVYGTIIWCSWFQTFAVFRMLYVFFWVIPRRLNSGAGELPRRKHTTIMWCSWFQTFAVFCILYVLFWVIPRHLNSDVGELPRRKHTTIIWCVVGKSKMTWKKHSIFQSFCFQITHDLLKSTNHNSGAGAGTVLGSGLYGSNANRGKGFFSSAKCPARPEGLLSVK
jgi:hypothetical protein